MSEGVKERMVKFFPPFFEPNSTTRGRTMILNAVMHCSSCVAYGLLVCSNIPPLALLLLLQMLLQRLALSHAQPQHATGRSDEIRSGMSLPISSHARSLDFSLVAVFFLQRERAALRRSRRCRETRGDGATRRGSYKRYESSQKRL